MRHIFQRLVVLAILATATISFAETDVLEEVNGAVSRLKQFTFNQLVPDDVVRNSVRQYLVQKRQDAWMANTIVRHEVLEYQLEPAFNDSDQLWQALYAAYCGGKWYFPAHVELGQPLNEARESILLNAREHLANPENLLSFWDSKRDIVIAELLLHPDQDFLHRQIQQASTSLSLFLHARPRNQVNICPSVELATGDEYVCLFAGRRYYEGGSELVKAWLEIFLDLGSSL